MHLVDGKFKDMNFDNKRIQNVYVVLHSGHSDLCNGNNRSNEVKPDTSRD